MSINTDFLLKELKRKFQHANLVVSHVVPRGLTGGQEFTFWILHRGQRCKTNLGDDGGIFTVSFGNAAPSSHHIKKRNRDRVLKIQSTQAG